MREGEETRRSENSKVEGAAGDGLENMLDETAVDEFLADGHSDDQSEKGEPLDAILREKFAGKLRDGALRRRRWSRQASQADELGGGDAASGSTPENYGGSDPLESHGRSIEAEPIFFGGGWNLQQLAHATAAEERNGYAEKN